MRTLHRLPILLGMQNRWSPLTLSVRPCPLPRYEVNAKLQEDPALLLESRKGTGFVAIIAPCTAIALVVSDVDVVFGFIGSTMSPLIVFILPALFCELTHECAVPVVFASSRQLSRYGSPSFVAAGSAVSG